MIKVVWSRGKNNSADLYMKHYPIEYYYDFRIKNGRIIRDTPNDFKHVVCLYSKDHDA